MTDNLSNSRLNAMVPAPLPAPHAAKHGVAIASITASRDHISITASDPATLDYLRENVHTRLDDRLPAHVVHFPTGHS